MGHQVWHMCEHISSFFYLFIFARHAWLLSAGCGVYHGHANSSPSRLLRLSLGASKRAAATATSSGGLLRNSHHLIPHSASVEPTPPPSSSSSSPATASFCDLKSKRKIRDKTMNRSAPSGPCPVMPRDPMTDGPVVKTSRSVASRRPLTRSVLRASLSPLAGSGSPSGGSSKKGHHGSSPSSIKASGMVHARRLLASHAPLPK